MFSTLSLSHTPSHFFRIGYALVFTISGCTAWAPTPVSLSTALAGIDVPPGWRASYAAGAGNNAITSEALAVWWERFEDPLLTALVSQALIFNTTVGKAQAALAQTQALRDIANATLFPTLGASASAQRGTAGGDSTGNRLQLGVDGQWVPDVFGARRSALDASNAALAASAATLGDVQVQMAAEVALNYILLRSAQNRREIASRNLASQRETLQITDWRQQAGLVTMLDVERARAAAAQTQALVPALQISIDQTIHGIAVLVGQPPAALYTQLEASVAGITLTVPRASENFAIGVPAETLRQRADIRAAEYQVAAALSRVGQAQAQRWPSFAIGGSLGLSAVSVAALTKGASVLSSLLASVSLPIFDGGAARAQVRVQQAALEQSNQSYKATVLGALKEVENSLAALSGDQLRLSSLQIAADAASNAALLARQRYSSGLVDFQTVLETQRTQLATQDGVVGAATDISNDQVRLFAALGGGWRMTDSFKAAAR